jgi:site-specific recombinase XerC
VRAGSIAELFPAASRAKPAKEPPEAAGWHWMSTAHRWAPNQLRHTAATELRSRFGLEATQVVLGHAKADITQVYAERDLAKAAAVMREVG